MQPLRYVLAQKIRDGQGAAVDISLSEQIDVKVRIEHGRKSLPG
jgi:hypothetical protein